MHLVNPFIFTSVPKTWQFIDSATATSGTLTLPAAIDAGDLLVIAHVTWDGSGGGTFSAPTLVTPSGFTNKFNEAYPSADPARFNHRVVISCKIADGSEDGASVNVVSSGARDRSVCLQFRPSFSISSIGNITLGGTVVDNSGPDNPGPITSTITGVKTPSIALAISGDFDSDSNSVNLGTQSPTFDGSVTPSFQAFSVHYRVENSGPVVQTIDMGDRGNYNYLFVSHLYDNGV